MAAFFLTAAFFLAGALFLAGAFFLTGGLFFAGALFLAAAFFLAAFFGGSDEAWVIPRRTHRARLLSSSTPSGPTRTKPREERPPISKARAKGRVIAS